MVLDCVVTRVSTADVDAVVVEGMQVGQNFGAMWKKIYCFVWGLSTSESDYVLPGAENNLHACPHASRESTGQVFWAVPETCSRTHSSRLPFPRQFVDPRFRSNPIERNPKEGEPRSWRAGTVFMAIPPRLVLPPLVSWEPSLPADIVEAAKATPTWMGETTKVCNVPRKRLMEDNETTLHFSLGKNTVRRVSKDEV